MTPSTSKPLVSVVIPCYKQAHLLPESIGSVLEQTYAPVEVVVVDDGSPDGTKEVALSYPGVRCIRQNNQGLSAARNTGFRGSRGKYIMFLDADDRLTPHALEAHLRCFAEHPEALFVVGDIDLIETDGSYRESPRWPLLEANFYEEMLRVNHVANTIAVMFRRSALEQLGDFDISLPAAEDYEMLLRAARLFPSAHHRTVVAQYRRYDASMSKNGVLMLRAMQRVMYGQIPWVKGNARLEAAHRRGRIYWRERYGAVTIKEMYRLFRRGDLVRATRAFLALVWHVRERLLLLPWKHRRRVFELIRSGRNTSRHARGQSPTAYDA